MPKSKQKDGPKEGNTSKPHVEQILERIGEVINADRNIDIARALGKESQTFNSWRYRNTIPWPEIIEFAKQYDVSLDWLIFGTKVGRDDHVCDPYINKRMKQVAELFASDQYHIKEDLEFYIDKLLHQADAIQSLEKEIIDLKKKTKKLTT